MKLKILFGFQVANYRKLQKLTQEQLAERADISIDMLGRIERGKCAPSFNTIEKLCKSLKIMPAVLFGSNTPYEENIQKNKALLEIFNILNSADNKTISKITKIISIMLEKN
jgi:transcriptional regulator with XRE-family HTH domain